MDRGCIPLVDSTTETIAKALIHVWISRFGIPLRITSDRGRQFLSSIFKELTKFLGVTHLKTTPYHPQANGIIERWHRTLKAAIKCYDTVNWYNILPIILLGLRTTIKGDSDVTPAKLVYGSKLKLPGEFFTKQNIQREETEFIKELRRAVSKMQSVPIEHKDRTSIFIHPDLQSSNYAFIRCDKVKIGLQPPYEGPYRILEKTSKFFKMLVKDKPKNISVDRLKPAFVLEESLPTPTNSESTIVPENIKSSSSPEATDQHHQATRSGRKVKFPRRFLD